MALAQLLVLSTLAPSPAFIGLQRHGFTVAHASPSAAFPVNVTVVYGGNTDKVLFADHSDSLAEGNWIELSGGVPLETPGLVLRYEGVASATYVRNGRTVTVKSDFVEKEVTYPLTRHPVYFEGDTVNVTFHGSTQLAGETVDLRLIEVSPSGLRTAASEAFEGNLTSLKTLLSGAAWSSTAELNSTGDCAASFAAPEPGDYVLVVVKEATGVNYYEAAVYSATAVEVSTWSAPRRPRPGTGTAR